MAVFRYFICLFLSLFTVATYAGGRDLPTCYDFGDLAKYYIKDPFDNVSLYDQSSGYEFVAKRGKKDIRFVMRFLGKECNEKILSVENSTRTPSEIIDRDYSAGRYFFHKKWERVVKGVNWQGRVAYSDFTIGDGARTRINLFLICEDSAAFPCIEFNVVAPEILSNSEINWFLNLFSKINNQNRQM